MGAGEVAPGRVPDGEPSVRAEVVHSSERTRVTRLFLPEGTVICKEPLGPDVERRVRHEMAMLQRLRGVTGVAQLAEAPRCPGPIVLADAGVPGAGPAVAGRARAGAGRGPRADPRRGRGERGPGGRDRAGVRGAAGGAARSGGSADRASAGAARERPAAARGRVAETALVFFVDDLQWAGRTPLGLFDLALSEEPVEGLLLVGAYRAQDVEATHLLAPMVARWRQQAGLHQVRLEDLPVSGLAGMVAEMLHADRAAAAALADVIGPYTSGNPYQTVELLNALRRDGVLNATAAGWRWDAAAVRAHLGRSDVAGLLAGRVAVLPAQSQAVLEAMACLGGRAELSLLQNATGEPAAMVERALAPALDDGLLVMEAGTNEAVRFRHDRIREAILDQLDPRRRRTVQLAMARRLAGVPELSAVAAEQYLPVVDGIAGAAERRQVAGLLRRAAEQAAVIGD